MVREQHFRQIRQEIVTLRDEYEELETLVSHADELGVDVSQSERIREKHQAFINRLEDHYQTVETVLSRADRIEDPEGRTLKELPADVPAFVLERREAQIEQPAESEQ